MCPASWAIMQAISSSDWRSCIALFVKTISFVLPIVVAHAFASSRDPDDVLQAGWLARRKAVTTVV